MVGHMAVSQAAVAVPGHEITDLESFSFDAFVKRSLQRSIEFGDRTSPVIKGVHMTYRGMATGRPVLDTRQAIGLTRSRYKYEDTRTWRPGEDRWLIAVAAAGGDVAGRVVIKQLQDVTSVRRPQRRGGEGWDAYMGTGLHEGMLWRHTLAQAWEEIALAIGAPAIVIESIAKNAWGTDVRAGSRAYDKVADDLGYDYDELNEDWVKLLPGSR